jgi:hypothetical protein
MSATTRLPEYVAGPSRRLGTAAIRYAQFLYANRTGAGAPWSSKQANLGDQLADRLLKSAIQYAAANGCVPVERKWTDACVAPTGLRGVRR